MLQTELKTEFVGAFVPPSLNEQLETIARSEERSKSQVIRRLLESGLKALRV
jgi:hypothetical protein